MKELFEQALKYAEMGFYVVPLQNYGKHMYRGTDLKIPSKNPERIEYLWKKLPRANIGLPTSLRHNGLIIIDIDIRNGVDGRESLKILEEQGIVLPKTSVVRTGTGGYHFYYKNNTNHRFWGAKNVLPGIDIRAENAHVVAPPSIHQNRQKYEWIEGGLNTLSNIDENVEVLLRMIKRNQIKEDIHNED